MKSLIEINNYNGENTADYDRVVYDVNNDKVWFDLFTPSLWVDLGLPSGLQWATCNVGATKPEEYGLYFAWGETEGYQVSENEDGSLKILDANGNEQTSKTSFYWSDYKLCSGGSSSTLTKYNYSSSYGHVDNLYTLQTTDDAAYQTDNICRMPTRTEFIELCNTDYTDGGKWTTDYNGSGVNGLLITSKSNGNSVFFPAAGYVYAGSLGYTGSYVFVWSSSLYTSSPSSAYCLYANSSGYVNPASYHFRYDGHSVRPVLPKR